MTAPNLFAISLERATELYTWGWRLSLIGALITLVGIASLWIGTRVRDKDFEQNIANLHQSAAKSEERSKELEQSNLTLQRDIERERTERVRLDEKFSARRFNAEQRALVLSAFKEKRGQRLYVRCIDEAEACLAAQSFAVVFREAGLDVPQVEGVGLTIPATTGIEVYDPTGEQGLFAKTLLSVLPDARFRPTPFIIGGQVLDPANPAMIVRMKIPMIQ
jgi:ABC-type multidrug transport system fused ATPase/permease subunit